MQRIDGFYLYQVGSQIHLLGELKGDTPNEPGTTYSDAFLPLLLAEGALEGLLTNSIFNLRHSLRHGSTLLAQIR